MGNKFLDNARQGKNHFWRYVLTILMSFGVAEFIAVFFLIFFVAFQHIFIGDFNLDSIFYAVENYDSDVLTFFMSIFFSFLMYSLFLVVFLEVLHKRKIMSLVNAVEKYDVYGRMRTWIERIRWNRFFKGFFIWSIFTIILGTISFVLYPEDFIFSLDLGNLLLLFILFLIAIPIQVTYEELLFRGYINQGLSLKIKNPFVIITISSLIFGFAHWFNGNDELSIMLHVSSAFLVGLIWSIVTLLDNGIEWATGAHLANNFFAFVIIGEQGGADNFGTLFSVIDSDPFLSLIFSTVTLLGFLAILVAYKKDKLLKL